MPVDQKKSRPTIDQPSERAPNPAGRGVPDERRGFVENRDDNLAASRQEGRMAGSNAPGEQPTRGTPDGTTED